MSASTLTPTSGSTATAAPCTAKSRTTAATCTRSRWSARSRDKPSGAEGAGLAFPDPVPNYASSGNGDRTMHDQSNVFYAIALSVFILITWQYFFATSFLGRQAAP